MIERVTSADQTQSETSLPKTGFESRRVRRRCRRCRDGSCLITHRGLTHRGVGILEPWSVASSVQGDGVTCQRRRDGFGFRVSRLESDSSLSAHQSAL